MTRPRHTARLFAFALFGLVMAQPATAETTMCTAITSLPFTISAPGTYCLLGNLTTSTAGGPAITIAANSVTLDLNGHKLAGNAGPFTIAQGIVASGRRFVVVRNGIVRGFFSGVTIDDDSTAGVIEDITAEGNYAAGLVVQGQGLLVRRNRVVNIGGSSFNLGLAAVGIAVQGSGTTVVDNDVTGVATPGDGSGTGILVTSGSSIVVERNRISNAETAGVEVTSSSAILVSDNRFVGMPVAMNLVTSTVKYRDNLTAGVTTLVSGGGVDAGNND
jgi:parallel beta-helix repeat protein